MKKIQSTKNPENDLPEKVSWNIYVGISKKFPNHQPYKISPNQEGQRRIFRPGVRVHSSNEVPHETPQPGHAPGMAHGMAPGSPGCHSKNGRKPKKTMGIQKIDGEFQHLQKQLPF